MVFLHILVFSLLLTLSCVGQRIHQDKGLEPCAVRYSILTLYTMISIDILGHNITMCPRPGIMKILATRKPLYEKNMSLSIIWLCSVYYLLTAKCFKSLNLSMTKHIRFKLRFFFIKVWIWHSSTAVYVAFLQSLRFSPELGLVSE